MPIFLFPPVKFPVFVPKIELRERYEIRHDRDFNRNVSDNRHDYLSRVRLGAAARFSREWDGELVFQLADIDAHPAPATLNRTTRDASTAFARYTRDDLRVTLGRQKINVGNQRLIGTLEWNNISRAFDGIRVEKGPFDVWAAAVGLSPVRIRDARLAVMSYKGSAGLSSIIYKHDEPSTGEVDHFTLNHVWRKKQGNASLQVEGALQAGHAAGRRLEAWAAHARIDYQTTKRLTLYAEVNSASGGVDDNVVRTFDNIYPADHTEYGIVDLQSWRNMNELMFGVVYRPNGRWMIRSSYHMLSLRDASDAWYGPQGLPNRRGGAIFIDPTGRSGRDLGQEVDLEFSFAASKSTTIQGGVGVFDPGGFPNRVTGSNDRQIWAFALAQYKF